MLDHDALLSAFPAMAVQRLKHRRKGPAQPVSPDSSSRARPQRVGRGSPRARRLASQHGAPRQVERPAISSSTSPGSIPCIAARPARSRLPRWPPSSGSPGSSPPVTACMTWTASAVFHSLRPAALIVGSPPLPLPSLAVAGAVSVFACREGHRLSGLRPAEARAPPSYLCWLLLHARTKSSLVSVATASAAVCTASHCIVLRGAWTLNSSPHKRQVEGDCLLLCQPHKLN